MAGKEKKIDRIVAPCTVKFKNKLKQICAREETDVAGFIITAITEKIKNDNLGEG